MAWWDVPGLTPIVAFDGRPDGVTPNTWLDRVGTNNATSSGLSVASGSYFGLQGNGNPIAFASQVTFPTYFVIATFFNIKSHALFGYKELGDTNSYILDVEPSTQLYNSNAGAYSNWGGLSAAFTIPHFLAIVRNSSGTWGMMDDGAFISVTASTIMPYVKGIGYVGNGNAYNVEAADIISAWGVWGGEASRTDVLALRAAILEAVALPPPTPRILGGAFSYRPTVNPNQVLTGRVRNPMLSRKDMVFGGFKTISGIVTVEGIPASRRVRCHDVATGIMVAEKWSQSNGYYEFPLLDASRKFYVVAFDHEEVYNMVGKDRIRFR